jgi:hypothetical protein
MDSFDITEYNVVLDPFRKTLKKNNRGRYCGVSRIHRPNKRQIMYKPQFKIDNKRTCGVGQFRMLN